MKFSRTQTQIATISSRVNTSTSVSRAFVWSRHRLVLKNVYSVKITLLQTQFKLLRYSFYDSNRLLTTLSNSPARLANSLVSAFLGIAVSDLCQGLWTELAAVFKFLLALNALTLRHLLTLRSAPIYHRTLQKASFSHQLHFLSSLTSKNVRLL